MKRRRFMGTLGATACALPVAGCSSLGRSRRTYKPTGVVSRRKFGNTGMEVSMLGFGSHLNSRLKKDPSERDRMIKLGYEGGINVFDVYDHGGYAQFGPMSRSIESFRRDIHISLCVVEKDLESEMNGALRTFRTDYIDMYRLYEVTDDRMRVMERFRDDGKIRALGVVSHSAEEMNGFVDRYGDVLDYVMIIYNFHHNIGRPKKDSGHWPNDYTALVPKCHRLGLGVLGIKPMGSDDMVELARRKGYFKDSRAGLSKAMLHYVFDTPEIHCAMPAMNAMSEVASNLESAYAPALTRPERELLRDMSSEADKLRAAYLRPHYRFLEDWAPRTA